MLNLKVGVIPAKLDDPEPAVLNKADIVRCLSARAYSRVGKSDVKLVITVKLSHQPTSP